MLDDGRIFNRSMRIPESEDGRFDPGNMQQVMQEVGPEGPVGEPIPAPEFDFEPPSLEMSVGGQTISIGAVPFAPRVLWALAPSGELVAGVPTDYRFEIRDPDGGTTVVERYWEPVPVAAGEADFMKRQMTAMMQRGSPDWTWNGPEIPQTKPAYDALVPDRSGRIWVLRSGPAQRDEACDDDLEDWSPGEGIRNCWPARRAWDVFDLEGTYLGTVEPPDALQSGALFVAGDTLLMATEDDYGTIRVKKYRITIPEAS